VRSRLHASATRGFTRFVGRDAEVEQLRRTLALAHDGHGQLVAIVGEPGVGKSRLVYEFTHSHRTQDWLVLAAGSVSYGKATSYLPVIDLLKAYFKVNERETHREIREKVTGKLLTLDRTLEPILPALLALLDVPVEDAPWQALDPAQRRQRTLDAVKHLVLRESQSQPLLLVFEDLHWIDGETQALLDGLVESLATARLLLLVNYRPEYQHGWGSKTYYSQLRLDALPPESAGQLLSALLGDDPGMEPLRRLLVKRGNPLFVEESIRTLVETGALVGERGAYRLTRPIQAIEVPATVQVILAARIDRLSADDKQLLQTASIIGKDVPLVLLQAVTDAAEEAVQRGLVQLKAAEFLYETRLFPDAEYTFKHALTHEVTYGTLLQERRKGLHARIVGAIERLYPDRLAEHVERLAHHAVRGELWEPAVTYLREAGAKAAMRSAYRQAVSCFEQALVALTHLPEGHGTLEQAVDLRLDLRNALYALGEFERVLEYLREADALATALDDRARRGWTATYLGSHFCDMGDHEHALQFVQRGLDLAGGLDDVALRVQASIRLGWIHYALGAYGHAIEFLTQSLAPLEDELSSQRLGMPAYPSVIFSVISRTYLSWSLAELGRFPESAARAEEGRQIAERVGEPAGRIAAYIALGSLSRSKGDLAESIPILERARALCQEANVVAWLPFTASELGYAYALSRRFGEALPLLEQAVEGIFYRALWIGWLGESYLLAGRIDDAARVGQQALELSRNGKERGHEARTLRLLGEIASYHARPDVTTAAAHFEAAKTLASELQMRPLVAHCHLGLGKLYRRTGDGAKAQEHFTTATTMYREMDMGFFLAQADRVSAGGDP
jgi:tetratricopeptide (TPR) repeat protein